MASLIQELLEQMDVEYENREESYVDKDHATDHARQFLDRAKDVLHYNKKEGNSEEVEKLALDYAKNYYESICEEIKGNRYRENDSDI